MPGRPRKPTAVLELSGAFKHDPQRRRPNEPKPKGPIGDAPEYMTAAEKTIWKRLVEIAPPGVLSCAEEFMMENVCTLMAKKRQHGIGGEFGLAIGELSQLNSCLKSLSLTPVDRAKVAVPKEPEKANAFASLDSEEAFGSSRRAN